jgi:hypothetical protein
MKENYFYIIKINLYNKKIAKKIYIVHGKNYDE